ncbi:unnamed protein product [Closterium sp. NIES-64]|nr:unnamed protein product [Closterium sp. NIES-64]
MYSGHYSSQPPTALQVHGPPRVTTLHHASHSPLLSYLSHPTPAPLIMHPSSQHSHAPISPCSSHHTPTSLSSPHLLSSRLSHNSFTGSLDDLSQLTNLHGLCVKPPPALHPPLPIYSPTHLFPSRSFTSLNLPSFLSARHPPSLAPSLFLHPSLFPTHSFPPILPPLPLNALQPFAPHITQGAFQQRHIRPDPRRPGGPRQLNKPVSFMIHAVRVGESAMCRWVHCPPLQRNASGALQLGSGRYALWLIRDSGPLRLLRQKLLSPACRPQGNLSNNNLSGAIPPSIDNLVSLITLYVLPSLRVLLSPPCMPSSPGAPPPPWTYTPPLCTPSPSSSLSKWSFLSIKQRRNMQDPFKQQPHRHYPLFHLQSLLALFSVCAPVSPPPYIGPLLSARPFRSARLPPLHLQLLCLPLWRGG